MSAPRPESGAVRWNLKISKDADCAVRSYLAARGMKKGDLSKFVDEAVRWRVFQATVEQAREKFGDLSADELEALIDEAVNAARAESRAGNAAGR